MALALPNPASPSASPASRAHARAHRRWQAGQEHARREQWPLAAAAFEQATTLHDDEAYALAAAHSLIKCGRAADAVQRARGMRQSHPLQMLGYTLESHALLALGHADEALECLRALPAQVVPDHAYLMSLAMAYQQSHRHAEAVPVFLQALALKMDDAYLHYHLGTSFKEQGMKAEAAECVRTAVLLGVGSSDLAARGQLVFLEREACRWAEAEAELARLRPAVRAVPPQAPMETSPFTHAVLVDDPLEQLKVARHYALHVAGKYRPLPRVRARARKETPGRSQVSLTPSGGGLGLPSPGGAQNERLRVGYLSADFHQHATSQLVVQMLECHDRNGFDVTLLSTGPDDGSAMRQRICAASEHFEELRGHSVTSMAQRVRELGIHILVDLKGATYNTLLPVLAQRPAPLQVSWLGFPGSTGAPFIDYLIGDPVVTPLADAAHFSEKIAQLPHCYQPNDAHRALPPSSTRADWGVPDDALLLCAFHQSYKISAEVFDRWCDLLHALPGAVLWLLQWNTNVQATLTAAARARGIAPERLAFVPMLPLREHLSRLACADLYLDAWPCNAHTTAGEALWCGVPVVTIKGRTFAQRVAASLLHAVNLDQLVCADTMSYRSTLLSLAADPARRSQLRAHLLAQRSASPLFDGARQARALEQLYSRMWERTTQGLPPEHLPALGG